MRKLIFRRFLLLISVSLISVALIMSAIFYTRLIQNTQNDLQLRTRPYAVETAQSAQTRIALVTPDDMRVTIIAADGVVLYDNRADAKTMENHGDRPEFKDALRLGEGEGKRQSDTIGEDTYYFAVKLSDGTVLRTAKTVSSIWGIYARSIPVILAALVVLISIAYFVAERLSDSVVRPIASADPRKDTSAPYDELVPYTQTIAEQRLKIERDKARLSNRAHTIDAIMENIEEGIVLFDLEGKIISMNKCAQDILDFDANFEGRSAIELIRDFEFEQLVEKGLKGERGIFHTNIDEHDYRFIISPASMVGVVVLILDVTESMQAERYRREFSANVSHELKTPLTSIYGSAEMLKSGLVKEEDSLEFYSKMMKEASRLIALVEDIMLLSQLDENKVESLEERVDLAKIAADVKDELARKAEAAGIGIHIAGELELNTSRSLIHELFYNLTENAIKYNKPGGSVFVELSKDEAHKIIRVSDTGIGISEAEQERIFERFYRVDQSRSKDSGGTGLGLAIVKHIALIHGAEISVSSELNVGTSFEIKIPS